MQLCAVRELNIARKSNVSRLLFRKSVATFPRKAEEKCLSPRNAMMCVCVCVCVCVHNTWRARAHDRVLRARACVCVGHECVSECVRLSVLLCLSFRVCVCVCVCVCVRVCDVCECTRRQAMGHQLPGTNC